MQLFYSLAVEFRSLHSDGSDRSARNRSWPVAVFKKSTAHLFLKWHLLSISSLSLWPARDTFHQERSTDIWNFVLSHSKKSIQVSGDSPVRPLVWQLACSQGWVDLHLCPLAVRTSLRPPEHTLESGSLHLGDSRSAALRLSKIKYNRVCVRGENGDGAIILPRDGEVGREKKTASSGRAGDIRLKARSICCDSPLIFMTRSQTQNMLRIHIRTNILLHLHRFSLVLENKNR